MTPSRSLIPNSPMRSINSPRWGRGAVDAASYMAHAISFPRPDSYLAAQALTELGPEITATTIGILLDNL